jgi:predicted nucleic acid-binding protein
MQWRREISHGLAEIAVERILKSPVQLVRRLEVLVEARRLALAFGWAKTYDAEYVALALLSGEPLLTVDGRLHRRVRDLVEVVTPGDL